MRHTEVVVSAKAAAQIAPRSPVLDCACPRYTLDRSSLPVLKLLNVLMGSIALLAFWLLANAQARAELARQSSAPAVSDSSLLGIVLGELAQVHEPHPAELEGGALERMERPARLRPLDDLRLAQDVRRSAPAQDAPIGGAHVLEPVGPFVPGQGDEEPAVRGAARLYGRPVQAPGAAPAMLHDGQTRPGLVTRQPERQRVQAVTDHDERRVSKGGAQPRRADRGPSAASWLPVQAPESQKLVQAQHAKREPLERTEGGLHLGAG
jgi:hypothetical protein